MKKLFVLFLFVGLAATAQETKLNWLTDFNEAKQVALKENKPLMLFFTGSDWCGWCKRLQSEVLQTGDFATWANENVVLLELDFPRRTKLDQKQQYQNYYLQQKLGVRGFPTIWFVNFKEGEEKDVVYIDEILGSVGYVRGGSQAWLGEADKILSKSKNMSSLD